MIKVNPVSEHIRDRKRAFTFLEAAGAIAGHEYPTAAAVGSGMGAKFAADLMTRRNAKTLADTILAGGQLPIAPSRIDLQTPLLAAALARLSNREPTQPVPAP